MPPSLSIPLIDAQAYDVEMKKAELNCEGSAACSLSPESSLINSGDNKTVAVLILRPWEGRDNWPGIDKESEW